MPDLDFEPADIQVAQRLTALAGETSPDVALAVRLVVRALRGGSVCVDLRAAAPEVGLGADEWLAAVAASPLAQTPPVLRLFGDLLYLDRYWLEEQQVCTDVLTLVGSNDKLTSVIGAVEPTPLTETLRWMYLA